MDRSCRCCQEIKFLKTLTTKTINSKRLNFPARWNMVEAWQASQQMYSVGLWVGAGDPSLIKRGEGNPWLWETSEHRGCCMMSDANRKTAERHYWWSAVAGLNILGHLYDHVAILYPYEHKARDAPLMDCWCKRFDVTEGCREIHGFLIHRQYKNDTNTVRPDVVTGWFTLQALMWRKVWQETG